MTKQIQHQNKKNVQWNNFNNSVIIASKNIYIILHFKDGWSNQMSYFISYLFVTCITK